MIAVSVRSVIVRMLRPVSATEGTSLRVSLSQTHPALPSRKLSAFKTEHRSDFLCLEQVSFLLLMKHGATIKQYLFSFASIAGNEETHATLPKCPMRCGSYV